MWIQLLGLKTLSTQTLEDSSFFFLSTFQAEKKYIYIYIY